MTGMHDRVHFMLHGETNLRTRDYALTVRGYWSNDAMPRDA